MPWLSVVVPTFNQAAYLAPCLASLRAQTERDWECVVVDDGSTDDTVRVFETTVGTDRRFRYFSQRNAGVSVARNFGLRAARGEWVSFLDSDDLYFPEAMASLRRCMEVTRQLSQPPRLVFGGVMTSFQEPPPPGDVPVVVNDVFLRTMHLSVRGRAPLLQCSVFHHSLAMALEGFSALLPTSEDRDFLIRATAMSTAATFPAVVAFYRTHHGAGKSDRFMASGRKIQVHRQIFGTLSQQPALAGRLDDPQARRNFERLRDAYLLMLEAADCLRVGDPSAAAVALEAMYQATECDDERRALIGRLAFFFRFPSHQPRVALRNSCAGLAAACRALPAASPVRRFVRRQIYRESARLDHLPRQTISYDHQAAAAQAAGPPPVHAGVVEADAHEGLRLAPMLQVPLQGHRVLLCPPGGKPVAIAPDIAAALPGCGFFRTIDRHVALAVARGVLPAERGPALREVLEALQAAGGLVSSSVLISGTHDTARRVSRIAGIAGRDVSATLDSGAEFLANARRAGRDLEYLLVEQGRCDRDSRQRLLAWASQTGGTARRAGPDECDRFAEAVVRAAGVEPELRQAFTREGAGGALLNTMLLDTIGESLVIVGAGIRCAPAWLMDHRPSLLFTGSAAPERVVTFASQEELSGQLTLDPNADLVGAHERVLGRDCRSLLGDYEQFDLGGDPTLVAPLAQVPPPRVQLSLCSLYGATAVADARTWFFHRDTMDPALMDGPDWRSASKDAVAWRGVEEMTIGHGPSLHLQATGLHNQPGDTPPFLVGVKDVAGAFGLLTAVVNPQARVAYLPVGIERSARDSSNPASWRVTCSLDCDSLLLAGLLSHEQPSRCLRPSGVLVELGDRLCSLATLGDVPLLAALYPHIVARVTAEVSSLDRAAAEHAASAGWSRELRAYREALLQTLAEPLSPRLIERARRKMRLNGLLLRSWPALVSAARELRAAGRRPSVELTEPRAAWRCA
jgi:glycosyltransferase involved in cell wall biosynthesis